MNKFKLMVLAMVLVAVNFAVAEPEDRFVEIPVTGISTQTGSIAVSGRIQAVAVTVPNNATGTVSVASTWEQVLLSSNQTASAIFYPVVQAHGVLGTNLVGEYVEKVTMGRLTVSIANFASAITNGVYVVRVFFDR
jgi:hypothetical protein